MRMTSTALSSLSLLCPNCGGSLTWISGAYQCDLCGGCYPETNGVIRMLPPLNGSERQTQGAFDFEHRRYEAARYLRVSPALVESWLKDVGLPRGYFKGLRILDVGCGTGRWSYAMAALGARVTAVDFSDVAVQVTREITHGMGAVEVIQANLFHLPFNAQQFDFVVSWGVLHHTIDTASAFHMIARLVRPGGILYVMVYEQRNPVKVWGTELLRMVLRRLPPETRYRFCGRLIIRNKFVFQLLRGIVACVPSDNLSDARDAETVQFGLYDWYSPSYNHLHRIEEVRQWFTKDGFEDLCLTTPIKHTRALDVLRFGECGGSISLRGRRRTSPATE